MILPIAFDTIVTSLIDTNDYRGKERIGDHEPISTLARRVADRLLEGIMSRGSIFVISLSVATACAYAAQHPLARPLARQAGADFGNLLTLAAMTEVVILVGSICIFALRPPDRAQAAQLLRDRRAWLPMLAIIFAGYGSLCFYLLGMAFLDHVSVAVILNTGPLWGGLAARVISKRAFPRYFWPAVFLSFAVIAVGRYFQSGESAGAFMRQLAISSFVLLTPCLFMAAAQIRHEFLKGYSNVAAVMTTQMLGVAGFLLVLVPVAVAFGWRPFDISPYPLFATLFVLGSISLNIVGTLLYQAALRATDGNAGYIGLFTTAVPVLSALFGALLYLLLRLPEHKLPFDLLWQAPAIFAILVLFVWANGKKEPGR
jgi:hypothetical protein